MTMKYQRIALYLVGMLFASTASADVPDWNEINNSTISRHVLPRYRVLAEATAGLDRQSRAFCASADRGALERLRHSYHEAMDAWMGVQHLRHGPVERHMRYFRFQLWPDKHNTGSRRLRELLMQQDVQALQPETFRHSSVAIQGFTALETLLFDSGDTLKALTGPQAPGFRCRVVEAISHNLATMATELVKDWSTSKTPFQKMFNADGKSTLGPDGRDNLAARREVAAGFLNLIHTQLEVIIAQKLARPMAASPAEARPQRAESWRSRRSLRNIMQNLVAVEDLYLHAYSDAVQASPEGKALDSRIRSGFRKSIQQAQDFHRPLVELVREPADRGPLLQLQQTVAVLLTDISSDVNLRLDLPQTFNSLDGD